jgi:hypothetical protein
MSADLSASSVSHTVIGVDPARAPGRVLYRCAKQDRNRRFYALAEMVARSDVGARGHLPHRSGGHDCVCLSVNDVGEPCAREPHARFDAAAGGAPSQSGQHAPHGLAASRRPYGAGVPATVPQPRGHSR